MPRTKFSMVSVPVKGSRDNIYYVDIVGDRPYFCTCKDYEYRGASVEGYMCKHMRARAGAQAIGRTRCAKCLRWLLPADLMDRGAKVSDSVICVVCKGSTS